MLFNGQADRKGGGWEGGSPPRPDHKHLCKFWPFLAPPDAIEVMFVTYSLKKMMKMKNNGITLKLIQGDPMG